MTGSFYEDLLAALQERDEKEAETRQQVGRFWTILTNAYPFLNPATEEGARTHLELEQWYVELGRRQDRRAMRRAVRAVAREALNKPNKLYGLKYDQMIIDDPLDVIELAGDYIQEST